MSQPFRKEVVFVYNKKTRKIVAAVVATILVLAMIVPLFAAALR